MKIVRHFKFFGYAFLLLVFVGCIKEDLEICLPQTVIIDFTFMRSEACAEEAVIPEDMNRLTVFVFDESGLFVQQVDTIPTGTDYGMEMSLVPNARYQFIALAGYENEQLVTETFVAGLTHIESASIATYLEQREGFLLSADHTFYKGSDTLTVMPETSGQEINLIMIQRTKSLNVSIDGLDGNEVYQVVLAGNAAHYAFDGRQVFLTGNPLIYIPLEEGEDKFLFGMSQINWPLKQDGFFTRLQIINSETGYKLIDENLYELLNRVPGLELECANSFDIGFLYTVDMKIKIYINQWLVSENGYELE